MQYRKQKKKGKKRKIKEEGGVLKKKRWFQVGGNTPASQSVADK